MPKNKLIVTFDGTNYAVDNTAKNLITRFKLYRGTYVRTDAGIDDLIPGLNVFSYGQKCDGDWDLYLVGHGNLAGTTLCGKTGREIAHFLKFDCGITHVDVVHVYACYGAGNEDDLLRLEDTFAESLFARLRVNELRFSRLLAFGSKTHVNSLGMDMKDDDPFASSKREFVND